MSDSFNIYCDGGSRGNPGPAACAFVLFDENGVEMYSDAKSIGKQTNNTAEYESVLLALHWLVKNASKTKMSTFCLHLDSLLVVNQLTGKYKIKKRLLMDYALKIRSLERKLSQNVVYLHIPRKKNARADQLVNEKLDEKL